MIIAHQVCEVLRRIAANVDSPRGRVVFNHASRYEWQQLQQLAAVAPSDYATAEDYFLDAIVTDFARKSPPLEGDLRHTAVATFWACEAQNKQTNDRIDRFICEQGPFGPADLRLLDFINLWKKKIKYVLGKLPDSLTPRFSPGATVSDKGRKITIPHKMSQAPTLYADTLCLWPFLRDTSWGRANSEAPTVVRGNIFFSVPKDARKDRGCCKEASGNVALQLSVGSVIRSRLKRVGIDLDQGQDVHRELAREGSLAGGQLATIDLSNASDLVARKLVQLVLPDEWYQLLSSLRAPFTLVDGKHVRLEKFSSMGNGFTFELETLLFWSLAETCTDALGAPREVSVYGDDIIVPIWPGLERLIRSSFTFFGFTLNEGKSFFDGPFRESCGGDFFNGEAVRPYYQKSYLDEPQEWIALLNGLKRLNRPALTRAARSYALNQLPKGIRDLRGPPCLGDAVIHDDDRTRWVTKVAADGWEGFYVMGYTPVTKKIPLNRFRGDVVLASALYGVPSVGVVPRGAVSGYKNSWILAPFGT